MCTTQNPLDPSTHRPPGEVARLKALWRALSDDDRACWQELFDENASPANIRRQLHARLNIVLPYNSQLKNFRGWELEQRALDQQGERMQELERRMMAEHPDWTLDQVREQVLRKSYLEAMASGNFKLGMQTAAQDLMLKKFALDEAIALAAMKDAQVKALEFCLGEAKRFPDVTKLFRAAFRALKQAESGLPSQLRAAAGTAAAPLGSTPKQISDAPCPAAEAPA